MIGTGWYFRRARERRAIHELIPLGSRRLTFLVGYRCPSTKPHFTLRASW